MSRMKNPKQGKDEKGKFKKVDAVPEEVQKENERTEQFYKDLHSKYEDNAALLETAVGVAAVGLEYITGITEAYLLQDGKQWIKCAIEDSGTACSCEKGETTCTCIENNSAAIIPTNTIDTDEEYINKVREEIYAGYYYPERIQKAYSIITGIQEPSANIVTMKRAIINYNNL